MIIPKDDYTRLKEDRVLGRYVINEQIIGLLSEKAANFPMVTVGHSVQDRPILSLTLGKGEKRILMWSQMHGNESTTTKAVLDLINLLDSDTDFSKKILKNCTIKILPILNPDGALRYTRVNANEVDLNRDAQNQSQPESRVLRSIFDDFEPDFCFNLHDQRTIYNVGTTSRPATVSFLAPAHDAERSISKTRLVAMKLISAMNETLQQMIPGQIGRYDDAFNPNCVGDTFQMLKTPTVLFEAGHYHKDYDREKTREYIFYAIVKALDVITGEALERYDHTMYFEIPENGKSFFDILVRNVPMPNSTDSRHVGILYSEVLQDGKISLIPKIEQEGNLEDCFGHETYDWLNPKDRKYLKNTEFRELLGF